MTLNIHADMKHASNSDAPGTFIDM